MSLATATYNVSSVVQWHSYAALWSESAISFYVDGQPTGIVYDSSQWWYGNSSNTGDKSGGAPFNQPFYIILNLAIGGAFPCGTSTGGFVPYSESSCIDGIFSPTDLSARYSMFVDYVRVWGVTDLSNITLSNMNLLFLENFTTASAATTVNSVSVCQCTKYSQRKPS